jgi:hypothetical protein
MLVYADAPVAATLKRRPELDRTATTVLAGALFPGEKLEPLADGSLAYTCPPDHEIVIGCFPGVSIVAAKEFGIDRPSTLDARFLEAARDKRLYLHAMHSVVDWFAFAVWNRGTLERALSAAPDNGVIEDLGAKLPFEDAYWSGRHPAVDPDDDEGYPLPFHPLELGEAALLELFGYVLEGAVDASQVQPEDVPLMRFKRKKPFWKLWG